MESSCSSTQRISGTDFVFPLHTNESFIHFQLNFKFLSEGKDRSAFYAVNLNGALKFIEQWEVLFEENGEDIKKMKQ